MAEDASSYPYESLEYCLQSCLESLGRGGLFREQLEYLHSEWYYTLDDLKYALDDGTAWDSLRIPGRLKLELKIYLQQLYPSESAAAGEPALKRDAKWVRVYSAEHDCNYYSNCITGETQWEVPDEPFVDEDEYDEIACEPKTEEIDPNAVENVDEVGFRVSSGNATSSLRRAGSQSGGFGNLFSGIKSHDAPSSAGNSMKEDALFTALYHSINEDSKDSTSVSFSTAIEPATPSAPSLKQDGCKESSATNASGGDGENVPRSQLSTVSNIVTGTTPPYSTQTAAAAVAGVTPTITYSPYPEPPSLEYQSWNPISNERVGASAPPPPPEMMQSPSPLLTRRPLDNSPLLPGSAERRRLSDWKRDRENAKFTQPRDPFSAPSPTRDGVGGASGGASSWTDGSHGSKDGETLYEKMKNSGITASSDSQDILIRFQNLKMEAESRTHRKEGDESEVGHSSYSYNNMLSSRSGSSHNLASSCDSVGDEGSVEVRKGKLLHLDGGSEKYQMLS
jgi:hypothetical protein